VTTAPARVLPWDSEFFGRRVARASSSRLTTAELSRLLAWCRSEAVEWLYFLADADDAVTTALAEEARFRLVDVRLELDLTLARRKPVVEAPAFPIRPATASDLAALKPIAAAGHTDSRFFFDPRVPRDRAHALYEAWIEQSVLGRFADVTLVAEHDGVASGYITGRMEPEATASIGLIGVGPGARGHGVGTALVEALLSWAGSRGAERVTVVTQGRNVAAQRLYQRCGFLTRSIHLWYHHWLVA